MSRSSRHPGSFENKGRRLAKHNLIEEERRKSLKEINDLIDVPYVDNKEMSDEDIEWWDRAEHDP